MKLPNITHLRRSLKRGFTLIELLVVLIIVAALAALIVPNIGMYGRSSDMAVSAKSQADIANQIGLFFVTQKRYPQGMDSLLDTTGALYYQTGSTALNQTYGFPIAGADGTNLGGQLSAGALTTDTTVTPNTDYRRSLARAGLDYVYDHSTAVLNSNLSNTTYRHITDTVDDPNTVAVESSASVSSIPVAELTGAALITKLNGAPLKAGERVVAFGFGQRNAAIGKFTTTSPLYPGVDKTYYGRYIVYLKVYASGERATLLGVTDSYGRHPDYTQQQFNESLPDGSRQG